jgi:hypothetical protein
VQDKIIEKIVEEVRERGFGGSERGVEEILLLLSLTNQQGIDQNLLPLLLLAGGGFGRRGRFDRLALVAYLVSQQQAQAAASTSGVPPQPSTNMLPLLLALGLFGEERHEYWRPEVVQEEVKEEVKKKNVG